MNITKVLASLTRPRKFPTHQEILTNIERIASAFPDLTQAETIGTTAQGRPLRTLSVGTGLRAAVVVGMPHPNEPTGSLGALRLAELLCQNDELRNQLGLRWIFLPCADPDGAALNESWFSGPFTLENYASGVYRPPITHDFEWTFRRSELAEPGRPATPESSAVMRLIDSARPELLVSMHNAETGGLYAYSTKPDDAFVRGFNETSAATGIPIDYGFAEEPADLIAPGIFLTEPQLAGGSLLNSTDYAAQYGAFGVIIEPPLWLSPLVDDISFTSVTSEAKLAEIERERALLRVDYGNWFDSLASHSQLDPARWAAIESGAMHLAEDWEPFIQDSRRLTVAEVSSITRLRDLERMRLAGHLVTALTHLPRPLNASEQTVLKEARNALTRWAKEAEPGQFCGLDLSVAAHVGVALSAARAVAITM